MPEPMITTERLVKHYGAVRVLDGIDLRVTRGSVLALLGPNGAGKTALIKILSTLARADTGRAIINGYDVERQPREVRRSISVTGQDAAVDELLTGEENLVLFARLRRVPRSTRRQRVSELIDAFDLRAAARRPVHTYSGGMRRRLDIAISLLTRPPVLFLDEPTTGLDPRSRRDTWSMIGSLARDGTTILLTTQYLEEADQLADELAVLHGGRIVSRGAPGTLKRQVAAETLELQFASPESVAQAAAVLARSGTSVDRDRRIVSVPTDGRPAEVHRMLDLLADHAVPVERMALREPTLDEVFLTLTGVAGGAR